MSLQERLQIVFKEAFQIKRVVKEVETLKEAKSKLGIELKFSIIKNVQLALLVEIGKAKLKEMKKIAFLDKIEFKIVLRSSYPADSPRLYFQQQNCIECSISPYRDYLPAIIQNWSPKNTAFDIVKAVPALVSKCIEQKQIFGLGINSLEQYFEAEKIFAWKGCQNFPVKFARQGHLINGLLALIAGEQIVLLQQSKLQGSYVSCDFIKINEIVSIQKHKKSQTKVLIEIKRDKAKYGVQFFSDEYDVIMSTIADSLKVYNLRNKIEDDSSSSDEEYQSKPNLNQKQYNELIVDDKKARQIEEQIVILQSLIEINPRSRNVKDLIQYLKKIIEYYSLKGSNKAQLYLKTMKDIMGNQFFQTLLNSEDEQQSVMGKIAYQSIANYI